MRRVVVLLAFVFSFQLGCGGGGGGSGGDGNRDPADVSGLWSFVTTNPGVATLTDCTGDLAPLNGITIATLVAAGPTCFTSDLFIVTQVGADFTFPHQAFLCNDGSTYSSTGGGMMDGNRLDAELQQVFSDGSIGDTDISGRATSADTLTISEDRITIRGSLNGSCNIRPGLQHLITISSPAFATEGTHRQQGAALAIYRALVATP